MEVAWVSSDCILQVPNLFLRVHFLNELNTHEFPIYVNELESYIMYSCNSLVEGVLQKRLLYKYSLRLLVSRTETF